MTARREQNPRRTLTAIAAVCALALAGLAATVQAADRDAELAVGTVVTVDREILKFRTDDGVKTVTVVDVDRMPALAAGDPVALTWRDENGTWTAHQIWKPAAEDMQGEFITVRATPDAANVELLVVQNVAEGNLRDLLDAGEVESYVMLSGADQLKVRTTEGPTVVLDTRSVSEGGTDFETGDRILLSVTPAAALAMNAQQGSTTTVYERTEPIRTPVESDRNPANTEPAMRDTEMDSGDEVADAVPSPTPSRDRERMSETRASLPQTANDHHRFGLVGLVLLTAAVGSALLRRSF